MCGEYDAKEVQVLVAHFTTPGCRLVTISSLNEDKHELHDGRQSPMQELQNIFCFFSCALFLSLVVC